MDGGNHRTIIQDHITLPNGLTLDFVNDRLYWADAHEDKIEFANLDGSNRHMGRSSVWLTVWRCWGFFSLFSFQVLEAEIKTKP